MTLLLTNCTPKEEKVEKKVTVEMSVANDSTAEATVTITTDSAGNEVQTIEVVKGSPETVKTTIEKYKK
ncbi:MAG: hypothetical protein ACO263_09170 [Cyclobacteriaceae bacterium]